MLAEPNDTNTKHITFLEGREISSKMTDQNESASSRHLPQKKERRKKIVALTDAWARIAETHSNKESQLGLLHSIHYTYASSSCSAEEIRDLMQSAHSTDEIDRKVLLTHLKTKQSGYKAQDTEKGIYDPTRFVGIDDIVSTLLLSGLSCYYCKGWTKLFYEFVRDPKQWSLERLSNAEGHNRDNVVIACLECNMRRRTMYHERYLVTKQLKVNKLEPMREDGINPP